MKKKLISVAILLFGLYLIFTFSQDLWVLVQKEREIGMGQEKLEELETTNEKLKEQLEYVQGEQFIEKEARDKLGMAREGETVVMLPENLGQVAGLKKEEEEQNLPNWEKWLKLFF